MTLAREMLHYKGEQIQPSRLDPAVITAELLESTCYLRSHWGPLVKLRAWKGFN